MSDADIDKAVKEAAEFEAQDKKRKEAIDAKNDADAMVFQTEKALGEVGDKIDAADKAAVEADVQALKDLLAKANTEELTDAQVADVYKRQQLYMMKYCYALQLLQVQHGILLSIRSGRSVPEVRICFSLKNSYSTP